MLKSQAVPPHESKVKQQVIGYALAIRIRPLLLLIVAFLSVIVPLIGCNKTDGETKQADHQIYCFSAGDADAFLFTTANGTVLIDVG